MLLVGRIVCGFYCSLISVSVPTYIGEIASAPIRGRLGASFQLMMVGGILFVYSTGAVFENYRWIAAVCGVFPVLCSILMIFTKESPYYLVSKFKEEEAEESLKYFRGKNYDGVSTELKEIQGAWIERSGTKAKFSDLKKPYILKPLMIAVGINFFQQFCGVKAVTFNLSIIFQ
ncbi:Facilitated trehalose transporter Tret1-2-like protein, partial [Armadillidium vulgare]